MWTNARTQTFYPVWPTRNAPYNFDVIGKEHYLLDQTRAELVHALIGRGYVDNLLLSSDTNRTESLRSGGASGYCLTFEDFLPRLRALGVTGKEVRKMMVTNPPGRWTLPERSLCASNSQRDHGTRLLPTGTLSRDKQDGIED